MIDIPIIATDTLIVQETDPCGNDGFDTLLISSQPKPFTNYSTSPLLCQDDSLYIGSAPLQPELNYLWQNGKTTSGITVSSAGKYFLSLTDTNGCIFPDSITVNDFDCSLPAIYIPSCFSPNGDKINDTFSPVLHNINFIQMTIYDRWGELIFESKDIDHGWEGTYKDLPAEEGIYVYKITRTSANNSQNLRIGTLSLVR